MTTPVRVGARSLGSFIAASAIVLSSCAGSSEKPPVDSVTVLPSDAPSGDSVPESDELPADVTASGVLLAATLIAAGKIDEAVESGLVTPAEVDRARAAIESGTLGSWVERAEAE